MILSVSVNRDTIDGDPWAALETSAELVADLLERLTYSISVVTFNDGELDSQEFRVVLEEQGEGYAWTLFAYRYIAPDRETPAITGSAATVDAALAAGVHKAIHLATES